MIKHKKGGGSLLIKRYGAYLIRWQLSTPILAPVVAYFKNSPSVFGTMEDWIGSAVANLIGGLIFFWIDRFIFYHKLTFPIWQVEQDTICHDCGKEGRGYRLVKDDNLKYDKMKDSQPEFRCEKCSEAKYDVIKISELN